MHITPPPPHTHTNEDFEVFYNEHVLLHMWHEEFSNMMSMRDTLCYVALEYGGCGYLNEKRNIYNFEVLVIVEF